MHNYQKRRRDLLDSMEPGSVAVIFGATSSYRNADTEWLFRQHSDIIYLTGLNESDCCLVLAKDYDSNCLTTVFLQPKDPQAECWAGVRLGVEEALNVLGVDKAFPRESVESELLNLCCDKSFLYYSFAKDMKNDIRMLKVIDKIRDGARRGAQAPDTFKDLSLLLHEQRLFKDDYEIGLMQKAAQVSANAHIEAMKNARPGISEQQVEAIIQYHCRYNGCRELAYPAIVAQGKNACTLHYTDNQDILEDGNLLLIDAGGEYHGYAADITRTFPINGKFTEPQKQIYELVLKAQLAGIEEVKPNTPFNKVQDVVLEILVQGLIDLELLSGDVKENITRATYKRFYMHGSGHWLGLDTHDVGRYKNGKIFRVLEQNMVLTVEPGLYIPNDDDIPAKYRGIGVRIEDDILVGKDGPIVLSDKAPKSVEEIEDLMA